MNIYGILSTSANAESSFFQDIQALFGYFYDKYINPSEYYEYLNMDPSDVKKIIIIIFGLCIGIGLAAFAAVFNKRVLGNIVRRLLKEEAIGEENAKTLEELGLESSAIARLAVRKSTSLRRVVKCREETEFDAEDLKKLREYEEKRKENKKLPRYKEKRYKINPYADCFYIPEKMKYTADIKFEKKGTTWFGACMIAVSMVVVFVVALIGLPWLLDFLNDIAGNVNKAPDNII